MNKIKSLGAIIMAISVVFIGAFPQDAQAATVTTAKTTAPKADDLVKKAEKNVTAMRRAIDIKIVKDYKKQPAQVYQNALKDYNAAKTAVNKTTGQQKRLLTARLNTVKVWIDRTLAYNNAVAAGKRLNTYQTQVTTYLKQGDMEKATASYNLLSNELKKSSSRFHAVYGKGTRDGMIKYYKTPAEVAKNAALYPVSVHIELNRLEAALLKDDFEQADKHWANLDIWLDLIEDERLSTQFAERYMELFFTYYELVADIKYDPQQERIIGDKSLNAFDFFTFYNQDGDVIESDMTEFGFAIKDDKGYFNLNGSLVQALATTGVTEPGVVIVTLIDDETGEVYETVEVTFKAATQPVDPAPVISVE